MFVHSWAWVNDTVLPRRVGCVVSGFCVCHVVDLDGKVEGDGDKGKDDNDGG